MVGVSCAKGYWAFVVDVEEARESLFLLVQKKRRKKGRPTLVAFGSPKIEPFCSARIDSLLLNDPQRTSLCADPAK
jgi:hypothetical protein